MLIYDYLRFVCKVKKKIGNSNTNKQRLNTVIAAVTIQRLPTVW